MHSCMLMLPGQKNLCCKCHLVIRHLILSLTLKYGWVDLGSARSKLIMPPLTYVTLNLSQETLQTAGARRDCASPALLPAAAERSLSLSLSLSPLSSCAALTTEIHLGELTNCGILMGYGHRAYTLLVSWWWTVPIAGWASWAAKWLQMTLYRKYTAAEHWSASNEKQSSKRARIKQRGFLWLQNRLSSDCCLCKTTNLTSTNTFASSFPQQF